jgi:peptidoglycan/LPS O-acetylase OafA/YrhL
VTTRSRLPFVDALKAIASQAIVLHHLALYGPMSDVLRPWAGGLVDALTDHARLAVQVFLVTAGFLSARALAPGGVPVFAAPVALVVHRWLRLAMPYGVAIGCAVIAAGIARGLATLEATPGAPGIAQLLANLLMLQDVLGYPALSAGAWYVAIDLQLFALLVAVMWIARRAGRPTAAPMLVGALTLASLLHFNRDTGLDMWGVYFFGAYGLGALAAWAPRARRPVGAIALIATIGIVALLVEPRVRIALALATALALAVADRSGAIGRWPSSPRLAWLGRISYSVFLIHYPVCLLVGALAARYIPDDPWANLAALIFAWAASTAAGAAFHRHVEQRLARPAPRRDRRTVPRPPKTAHGGQAAGKPGR